MDKKWIERFAELADHVAQWSKDPDHKVGAIIVDTDRRVLGLGFNGFPRNVYDEPNRYADKTTKRKLVVHAEANAILNAVAPIRGCTIFVSRFPCSECAKLIVQSYAYSVFSPPPSVDGAWADDAKFSSLILKEGRVRSHLL